VRIALGLALTIIAFAIAGRRVWWLFRLLRAGQPTERERLEGIGEKVKAQVVEVFGQKKLLQWSVPGIAHFVTFWAFIVLGLTIIEAYGALFQDDFAIPLVGHLGALGFLEDLFAALLLLSLVTFTAIRLRQAPQRIERRSRFFGSHTGAAYLVLFMIFLVDLTLVVYRAAQVNTGHFPYSSWAFFSHGLARAFEPLGAANQGLETTFILLQLAVVLGFLVLVVYSKHLHIFLAPVNVLVSRRPKALGAVVGMLDAGKPLNFEEADPEVTPFGIGKVEDFKWTGLLDLATCTECGRCQSQCPAWNTGKPLSPKLLITDLRDHLFAKAPWIVGSAATTSEDVEAKVGIDSEGEPAGGGTDPDGPGHGHRPSHNPNNIPENERPIVGTAEEGGVIDPDVLWSCTNCGACVEQCPVDIEHVDHIIDLRRYQVLVESSFPSEAGVMLRNLENNGNPWGVSPRSRLDWTQDLPFEVTVISDGGAVPADVEYLFWVGCAGAIEDRSKKVTRAFAELLHTAGVEFAILGTGESCTGDPARRLGNEYLWSELAGANVETLNAAGVKKIVATCPHCFNSLAKEYKQLGGHYEVLHHTELLARLVAERRLVPITPVEGLVTYHDPCFLGRHNTIYTPPREVLASITGLRQQEMHRCKERGFCCGAGGARMWMEEKIGKQVNVERVDEALGLDPDLISTACPFCMVMLSDAVTAKKQSGDARDEVQVLDVSQLLARSLVAATVGAGESAVGGASDAGTAGEGLAAGATSTSHGPAAAAEDAAAAEGAAPAEEAAAPDEVAPDEVAPPPGPPVATPDSAMAEVAAGFTAGAVPGRPSAGAAPSTSPAAVRVGGDAPAAAPEPAMGQSAPPADITPDVLVEGERPLGATPEETAVADYPQLSQAATSTDSTAPATTSAVDGEAGPGDQPVAPVAATSEPGAAGAPSSDFAGEPPRGQIVAGESGPATATDVPTDGDGHRVPVDDAPPQPGE